MSRCPCALIEVLAQHAACDFARQSLVLLLHSDVIVNFDNIVANVVIVSRAADGTISGEFADWQENLDVLRCLLACKGTLAPSLTEAHSNVNQSPVFRENTLSMP